MDFTLSDSQKVIYENLLNIDGNGIMGYVEIESIRCSHPIYQDTKESVLQVAIGHIEWSSLPVGGESTHSVISGPRGLPSARLFTDINKLSEGDTFTLCVLNEKLTYEVDKILIVEPHETEALEIVEGKDYCTLVTCTPYGVNSHRLLVRGHRIENPLNSGEMFITAEAIQIEPLIVAAVIAIPIFVLLTVIVLLWSKKSHKR